MTLDEELEAARRIAELEAAPSVAKNLLDKAATGVKGVGQSLAAGFGGMIAAYPQLLAKGIETGTGALDIPGMGSMTLKHPLLQALRAASPGMAKVGAQGSAAMQELGKESPLPGWAKPFVEGVGSTFALPLPSVIKAPVAAAVSGGVGNSGAAVAKEFSKSLGEGPSDLAALLAGMLTGGGAAFALGPKQSVGKADLREALKGANFGKAQENVDVFNRTGAQTATLAEAFPPNSQLMALGRRARGADVGELNLMVSRTEGRADELTAIGNKIPELMSPNRVETGQAAQSGAAAAAGRIKQFENAMSQDYGNLIASAKPVLPQDVVEFRRFMLEQAKNSTLKAEREAYLEIAKAVKGTKGVLTNPRELVDAVKLAKEQAIGKNEGTASIAMKKIYEKPYADFVDFLSDRVPEFKKAESLYKSAGSFVDAKKASPLGQMAGANFDPEKVVAASRLNVLESFDDPGQLKNLLDDLRAGDPKNPTLVSDLAKALVQKKTRPGPNDAAQRVAGAEGSKQSQMFNELLDQTGTNSPAVQDQLKLARLLQDFQGPAGINSNIPDMSMSQAAIRPFRTLDMMLTLKREQGVQKEIARLLADPNNLPKLQEIAMFDPRVRQALTAQMAITPGLIQATQQEAK